MNQLGVKADFKKYIPDVYNLCVKFNDLGGSDNLLKRNDKYVLIDSGESTYENLLMPIVKKFHRELPTRFDAGFRSQMFNPIMGM